MSRRIFVLTSVIAALFTSTPLRAFKPTEAGHLGITSIAIKATTRVVGGKTLSFTDDALLQIRDANKDTDCLSCQGNASFHFDDEAFGAGTSRLTTLRDSIIAHLVKPCPDGESARKDLGGALHTIQDFYAHSNWVDMGNNGIHTSLGRGTFGGLARSVATCPGDPATLGGAGLTSLTSGWFAIPLCDPPVGKCRHGIPVVCSGGLNKDDGSRTGFGAARSLAVQASEDFLNQILDAPGVAGNVKAIKALMGIQGTLAMVIDDTGSMGSVIDQVKSQADQIVAAVRGTENEPAEYLLERFGDPDIGPAFKTCDADAFLGALNALFPHGGGDCPELSQGGLLEAVGASQEDSTVYLFTDASSKDPGVAGAVVAAAQSKRTRITPLLFGSCSPIDPAYVRDATETGGQLFFMNRSEASSAFGLIRPQLSGDLAPVVSLRGTLPATPLDIPVPVDSTATSATFSVSVDSKRSIQVIRPDGTTVVPADANVSVSELTLGKLVTVNTPVPGVWHVLVDGSGGYSASGFVNSALHLSRFGFVELTGRPGHEGFFPIPGQPLAGSTQTALANLVGPFSTASFSFVSQSGVSFGPLALSKGNPDAAEDEFVGIVMLPTQPFLAVVSGNDASGLPYQRVLPQLFRSQSVEVRLDMVPASLPAGTPTLLHYMVHNIGGPGTFSVTVSNDKRFSTLVQPSVLTIDANGFGAFDASITVPSGTADGTLVNISAIVTSQSDPTITNNIVVALPVITNRAPECAAAAPSISVLWPPQHGLVPVAVVGVTDPDGDPVSIQVTKVTQNEPPSAASDVCPDASGLGTDIVEIRAERDGAGSGRLYVLEFAAADGKGGQCTGTVSVCVPHDQGKVDCGPAGTFDSSVCP